MNSLEEDMNEGLPPDFLRDDAGPEITQLYTNDGKKAGRQIRHRWHVIFVPNEPEVEAEPLPKTSLPTAAALLLTVIFLLWPGRKSRIVASEKQIRMPYGRTSKKRGKAFKGTA